MHMMYLIFLNPIWFMDEDQRILTVFAKKAGETFLEPKE